MSGPYETGMPRNNELVLIPEGDGFRSYQKSDMGCPRCWVEDHEASDHEVVRARVLEYARIAYPLKFSGAGGYYCWTCREFFVTGYTLKARDGLGGEEL